MPSGVLLHEWYGALMWAGIDRASQTRIKVSSHVLISGPEIRKETWPPNLYLGQSTDRVIPVQDLHAWIKRFRPKLCTIVPNPRAGINESNFKSLNNLLVETSMYAFTSWDLPSTVFPDSGVPEPPRAPRQQMPPGFAFWSDEMKAAFFTRTMGYRLSQSAQQKQLQQQQQAEG
ncbi:hypothetical protein BD410DRAFT_611828 [Rickenella mellea]|uniref:Uncharacterized protein n=1 Tax=Rickenella mellea TaxID=50990 RepID=A0A4Y7PP09_9AGAM|nr:hypothetical protein BD410DRAFT_611828 [Rickenella mellea]